MYDAGMKVDQMTVRKIDTTAVADINRLLQQLDMKTGRKGSLRDLKAMSGNRAIVLLAIRDKKKIIGVATLYELHQMGKKSGYVEDVVVDEAYRGQGLGMLLMRALIVAAKKKKLSHLNLTSRPSRVAANKLYQKLGFEKRDTNVYRLKL